MAEFCGVTANNVDTYADENVNVSVSFREIITELNEKHRTASNTAKVTQISVHDQSHKLQFTTSHRSTLTNYPNNNLCYIK